MATTKQTPTTVEEAVKQNPDLEMPTDLSPNGRKAWRAIMEFLVARGLTYTGGCKAFYSPSEWRARGEKYGTVSELVVVYDGGEVRYAFELDTAFEVGGYQITEAMIEQLAKVGLWSECCTCWYSAIYNG